MFSRIYGEQATYVMYDRQLEHRHGTHAETYVQHLAPIRTAAEEPERIEEKKEEEDKGEDKDRVDKEEKKAKEAKEKKEE